MPGPLHVPEGLVAWGGVGGSSSGVWEGAFSMDCKENGWKEENKMLQDAMG